MNKNKLNKSRRLLLSLIIVASLTGCASTGGTTSTSSYDVGSQMQMIAANAHGQNLMTMEVPTTNSFIAEKMMLAALASGSGSASVDQLTQLLRASKPLSIGIIGKSMEVNMATLKATLGKLQRKTAGSHVYIIGESAAEAEMIKAAENFNIQLHILKP